MKIICAPDSFKESLTGTQVASAMAQGVTRADAAIDVDICPVADGGEGTLHSLMAAMRGSIRLATVTGPLNKPVEACWGVSADGRTAVVEMAQASGLMLVPHSQRDPTATTSFGTGELISLAMQHGCHTVIVCIGGSATVDGGAGIAQALGAKFRNHDGQIMQEPITGGVLANIAQYEPPSTAVEQLKIVVACDVTSPLCGPNGAAAMYGPQKGASPQQVQQLDDGLTHLALVVGANGDFAGAGAAGGAGFGLTAMCNAQMKRGIDVVLDAIGFHARCKGASLVLTGEGRLDRQSLHGKACLGVARAAAERGVPTVAIVGSTGEGAAACVEPNRHHTSGLLTGYVSLADLYGLDRAMRETAALVEQAAFDVLKTFPRNPSRGPGE